MISTTERRQSEPPREHARIPCTIPVELTHDERTPGFEADAVDLSAGGLSLRSSNLPEVGAQLHCRFETLPGGTRITGRGEVVWAKPSGDRSGEFGLRFTQIDPKAQALISEMIAERVATGGITPQPQPRMATLEFEENEGPITAKLTRAIGRDFVFEQPLDVLALGRGVVAYADKTLGHGNILRVDLRMDNGTPTLALTVRFSKEQEAYAEFGEYDWGEPESGTQPRAEVPGFLAHPPSQLDTVPELAAPSGMDDEHSQPAAAAADGGPRVATSAGGTLAPAQNDPAPHIPTRAGGILAPTPNADPLSAEAATTALARLEAEERAALERAELGTPLAAARAARNLERDAVPTARHSEMRRIEEHADARDTDPAAAPAARLTDPLGVVRESATTIELDRNLVAVSLTRDTATTLEFERSALAFDRSAPRDTAPGEEPEARLTTTPLDTRGPAIASPATHSPTGVGLAGTKGAKQMDLTFAGEEEDFEDADGYAQHADPDHSVYYDAIAVLESETLAGGEDRRARAPQQLGAATRSTKLGAAPLGLSLGAAWSGNAVPSDTSSAGSTPAEDWSPSTGSGGLQSPHQHYSSGAGEGWSPVSESARKSPLVRFLRIFAALVDGIQSALGIGGRALRRLSDTIGPVWRRQLARRSTMRGVGARVLAPRVRRSAGTAPAGAPGWKLPRGSGRLVLLAVLMIGCGVLLVYAFPRSGGDQIDLHRAVQLDAEDPSADPHAAETAANAATSPVEAAALGQSGAVNGAKAPLTAAGAKSPRAGSDDKFAGGGSVFGSKQVPNAQRYVLRTNSPVTILHGKSDPGGFTVIAPNTRAIDKAAPIALANQAVSRAKIINRGGYAELSVRFADGRSPAYRVSAQQTGLEVLIGQ